ncbi:MAG: hypothetical protein LAQ30_26900 [Acidobacteriia bacterium]|nr:hypothetical protein [Terriglobia bacterium]
MDKRLTQLVERLQAAYGPRLVSVVLYGSAAGGEHHPRYSDFNVLCVLTEIGTAELGAGQDLFRWWREQSSPSPLLLTEGELATCTDCFAVEFSDIKRQHVLLYGKDVVSGLEIDSSFYRAQVEHELRAKLLRLRQKAAGVSTFCVLFRHALILDGDSAPLKKREIVERAAERFRFDALPFQKLLDIREERLKPREVDPLPLLAAYLQGISAVIEAVDRLEK